MRSLSLFALSAASLALFACSAPAADDGGATGAEQHLTERKIVSQTSWVSGTFTYDESQAQASLAAACAAEGEAQKAIAGAAYLDAQCDAGENLVATGYLLGAKLTTRFVVDVEEGTMPGAQPTMVVNGAFGHDQAQALADLRKGCDAELARAKTLYGARLLGGGCDVPKNLVQTGYLMTAPFSAFVLPVAGASATIPGAIRAQKLSYDQTEALGAWRDACAAAGASAASAKLVAFDCGEPKNLVDTGYLYGSASSFTVASGTKDVAPIAGGGVDAFGAFGYDEAQAFAAWQKACDASLAVAKELLGDRFLGGTCQEPKNAVSTGFLFTSPAPFASLPAGSQQLTIEGYAFGAFGYDQAQALATFTKSVGDTLRASGAGAHLQAFDVAPARNLVSTGFLYGAKTTVSVGFDVAEGGLAPVSSKAPVAGQASFDQTTAAASWAKACADGIAKAKVDYGDRFLGGGCTEPAYASQVYASDLVTWILP